MSGLVNDKFVECYVCKKKIAAMSRIYSNMLDLVNNTNQRVYTCRYCSHKFLYPYFDDDTLSKMYGDGYFTGNYDEVSLRLSQHAEVNPEQTCKDQKLKIDKYNKALDLIFRYANHPKTILDIGAATGEFLNLARDKGLLVDGIELSEYATKMAQDNYGLTFYNCKLEDFKTNIQYDIITMHHVFEHFVDPHIALKIIDNLLSNGGIVYLEIPLQFNFLQVAKYILLRKKDNYSIYSLHHPNFYSAKNLIKLFNMYNLKNVYLELFDDKGHRHYNIRDTMKGYAWKIMSYFGQGFVLKAIFQK